MSKLEENSLIALSWSVLDYDEDHREYEGFWNLSHETRMDSDASNLCAFRLMPLEPEYLKPLEAEYSFTVVDMDRRMVAFTDRSRGEIASWSWDFGDGHIFDRTAPDSPVQGTGRVRGYAGRRGAQGKGSTRQGEPGDGKVRDADHSRRLRSCYRQLAEH